MRILSLLSILILISIVGYVFFNRPEAGQVAILPTRTITLEGRAIRVAVADSDALRAQGLSGTSHLQEDEGMLFVFEEDGIYPFWMKDMRYSIDILWLDATGRVVHLEKSLSPDSYPQSFTPHSPARYVLEVRAGFADQHDIQIGDIANLSE
jgi:uncharacterized membrane protein (UPF0127 family)